MNANKKTVTKIAKSFLLIITLISLTLAVSANIVGISGTGGPTSQQVRSNCLIVVSQLNGNTLPGIGGGLYPSQLCDTTGGATAVFTEYNNGLATRNPNYPRRDTTTGNIISQQSSQNTQSQPTHQPSSQPSFQPSTPQPSFSPQPTSPSGSSSHSSSQSSSQTIDPVIRQNCLLAVSQMNSELIGREVYHDHWCDTLEEAREMFGEYNRGIATRNPNYPQRDPMTGGIPGYPSTFPSSSSQQTNTQPTSQVTCNQPQNAWRCNGNSKEQRYTCTNGQTVWYEIENCGAFSCNDGTSGTGNQNQCNSARNPNTGEECQPNYLLPTFSCEGDDRVRQMYDANCNLVEGQRMTCPHGCVASTGFCENSGIENPNYGFRFQVPTLFLPTTQPTTPQTGNEQQPTNQNQDTQEQETSNEQETQESQNNNNQQQETSTQQPPSNPITATIPEPIGPTQSPEVHEFFQGVDEYNGELLENIPIPESLRSQAEGKIIRLILMGGSSFGSRIIDTTTNPIIVMPDDQSNVDTLVTVNFAYFQRVRASARDNPEQFDLTSEIYSGIDNDDINIVGGGFVLSSAQTVVDTWSSVSSYTSGFFHGMGQLFSGNGCGSREEKDGVYQQHRNNLENLRLPRMVFTMINPQSPVIYSYTIRNGEAKVFCVAGEANNEINVQTQSRWYPADGGQAPLYEDTQPGCVRVTNRDVCDQDFATLITTTKAEGEPVGFDIE